MPKPVFSSTFEYQLVDVEAGGERSGNSPKTDPDRGSAKTGGDDALLGKLSVAQIEKGQAVLAEIEAALKGNA